MKRQALVIGINSYPFGVNLTTPARGAEAVAQILEEYGEFEVRRIPCEKNTQKIANEANVNLITLEQAIVNLFQPKDGLIPETALLFFAGHGLEKEKDGNTEGFLVTSDAIPGDDSDDIGLFPLQRLRQLLKESSVRQQIVWLDCCFSSQLFNFSETDLLSEKERDRFFIAASRQEAVSQLSNEYGELTGELIKALNPIRVDSDGLVTNYTLEDFIKKALKEEKAPQNTLVKSTGGKIILTSKTKSIDICPYKGLEYFDFNTENPYDIDDHKYFYGRSQLIEKLLEKVQDSNFLAVRGASGSGKSSVVRAGLLYQLYLGKKIQDSDKWKIYKPFTPGENPLSNLKQAIGVEAEQLIPFIKAIPTKRVVLVVDQFEEIFTKRQDETKRLSFLKSLMEAVEELGNKLCLVLVMRADFFGKCTEQEYSGLAQQIQQNLLTVTPMTREELEKAITQPAEMVELEIERELVTRIIEDLENSPGSLPLLEYTLQELWRQKTVNRLTISEYTRLGGVNKVLENRANEVYHSLSPEKQKIAKRVFLELTRLNEEVENTRQQLRLSDLVSSEQQEELVEKVVQSLTNAKLIVTNEQQLGEERLTVVNITHEALIRHWDLLDKWLQEHREALLKKQDIEDAAKDWRDRGKLKDYSLTGKRLKDAKVFQQEEVEYLILSDLACDFIRQSIKHKRNNVLQLVSFIFIPVIALSVYLGIVVEREIRIRELWKSFEAAERQKNSPARTQALQELVKANASLVDISLTGTNLKGANLSRGNFRGANFRSANLSEADLSNADLTSTDFKSADLSNAYLHKADLGGADLRNANLSEADLSKANLKYADFQKANLSEADLGETNLSGANLLNTDLKYTNFSGTNLSDADLRNANFSGNNYATDLNGIEFNSADLSNANLSNINLSNANFSNANLSNANLSSADLSNANLSDANISGADLSSFDFYKTNLSGADLSGANLNEANLRGVENLILEQVKVAKNWDKAKYNYEFLK